MHFCMFLTLRIGINWYNIFNVSLLLVSCIGVVQSHLHAILHCFELSGSIRFAWNAFFSVSFLVLFYLGHQMSRVCDYSTCSV